MRDRFKELKARCEDETGAIGYMVLWLMGVPASVLFMVFLLRGCN